MALFDKIFKNGSIVSKSAIVCGDIATKNGKIAKIGEVTQDAQEIVDCSGLHILPGFIDTQVHFREPGAEHKEDLQTGSLSAVMGGVTAVFEMPNTNPLTVTASALEDKIARASNRMHCDFAFYIGGTHDNVGQLAALEKLPGCAGIKVFMGSSTGSLLVSDDEGVAAILETISRRAAFHSEDETRLNLRKNLRITGDPASHPIWRDEIVALNSTKRLLKLARAKNKRIHVLHVSTAAEIDLLADNKDIASVEVTPHHLTLDEGDYERLGTLVQMNPPIRSAKTRDALWRAVASGVVDVLGSDHAPHTLEEKAWPYPNSPSGMTGVQTFVPIMLDHVKAGRLSLCRLVEMTSAQPSTLFGIKDKGRIAVGYDADLSIVDLERTETITNSWIASRAGWTPYDGKQVTGWPVGTIIRGNKVMWQGELIEPSKGQHINFD